MVIALKKMMSKWFILAGLGLIALGALIWLSEKMGFPLFRLPGDIQYKGEHVQVYFPIVTSIIISIILSILFWIFNKHR